MQTALMKKHVWGDKSSKDSTVAIFITVHILEHFTKFSQIGDFCLIVHVMVIIEYNKLHYANEYT